MPIKNYASETIKRLKQIPSTQKKEVKYVSENDRSAISKISYEKERLYKERKTLRKEARLKVKEIKDVENIDVSRELKGFKFILPEKTSKKELNELIRKELRKIIEKKKENKESIVKLEIQESMIKSINSIMSKSNNPDALTIYIDFVNYIENLSKVQFEKDPYKRNLFKNEALKEITKELTNSENVIDSIRKIYRNLSYKK